MTPPEPVRPPSLRATRNLCLALGRMSRSGISLAEGIGSMRSSTGARSRALLDCLQRDIADGATLSEAMANQHRTFRAQDVARVRAAEGIGHPETALERIAEDIERKLEVRTRMISKASYPAFLIFCWTIMGPIPLLVQGKTGLYATMVVTDLATLVGLGGLVLFGIPWMIVKSGADVHLRRLAWSSPWPAGIYRDQVRATLSQLLADHLDAGCALPESLRDASEATGDETIVARMRRATRQIQGGASLTEGLITHEVYASEDRMILDSGERSGELPHSLRGMGVVQEERAQQGREMLIRLVGTVILVGGLIFVAFQIIAAFNNVMGTTQGVMDAIDDATPMRRR